MPSPPARALPASALAGSQGRPFAPRGAAAGPAAPSGWRAAAAYIDGTSLLFVGYLLLITIEYLGLPNQFGFLKVTRFSTFLSYGLALMIIMRAKTLDVFSSRPAQILLGFLVFTILSVFWAYIATYAIATIRPIIDYLGLLITTAYIIDRRSRADKLAATLIAVAAVLVYWNWNKLGAGPRVGAFKAPYFMGDGNDFAWFLVTTLPLGLSLALGQRRIMTRLFAVVGSVACLIGILGTQSRGAFLALAACFLYGWLFVAKKKTLGAVALAAGVVGLVIMAPAGYFNRMHTVTEYQQDNSAQARLEAWTAAIHMAIDFPLGAGAGNFSSVHGRLYLPDEGTGRVNWGGRRWTNAHSIYFKVLGEYGFLGLGMLLWVLGALITQNTATRQRLLANPADAPLDDHWPAFLNMSTIGFAVGGVFLGGLNYPHLFVLAGLSYSARRIVALTADGTPSSAAGVPAVAVAAGAPVVPTRAPVPGELRIPIPARRAFPQRRSS
jgi:putative inorganic carbon (hco3(-)) transporter